MTKRVLSVFLIFLILISAIGCNQVDTDTAAETETETDIITTETEYVTVETETETEEITTAETETDVPVTTEEIITDEEAVFYEKKTKKKTDIEKATFTGLQWESSISAGNEYANAVQGKYTDGGRTGFTISNSTMSLTYQLMQNDKMLVKSLCNSNGVPYFENTMDSYVRFDDGRYYYASDSLYSGRMNSQRIGYYYYDFHFRDQSFTNPEYLTPYKDGESCFDVLADNSDKINGSGITDLKYEKGILSYSVGSADPYIELKDINVNTEEFDTMQITLKTRRSEIMSVYLLTDKKTEYSADLQFVQRFNAAEQTTLVIPFSAMKDVSGVITGFKTVVGSGAGEQIKIYELKFIKRGGSSLPLTLERSYHTYADKMHEQIRVVSTADYTNGGYLGTVIEIPASTVRKMVLKDNNAEYYGISDAFDFKKLEYMGFDIKGVGIFGIIMPSDQNGTIKIELKNSKYIITREVKIDKKLSKNGSNQLYHRIYTSDSHQFNDLRKQAYIERNPLTDIQTPKKVYGTKVLNYNAVRGCYDVFTLGAGFIDSYNKEPDKQIDVNLFITGDGVVDRTVYLNVYTASSALECAAVLDQNSSLLPIPVQVSKNFGGEKEEQLYDKEDDSYGESYFPVFVGKDECRKLTVLHLYQNWGKYALKQLSSISFIQPCYQLSLGVTETNCMTPYFVNGKDGWLLPDLRANSSPLWKSQPQHTATGRLYFLQYSTKKNGDVYLSEAQSSEILSSGPVYADVKTNYLSDDGAFAVTYRHTELPQTDENRTLYEIRAEVLQDVTVDDFVNNFTIFKFDSRYNGAFYRKIGYLNENNEYVVEDTYTDGKSTRLIKLGSDHPYVSLFKPDFKIPGSESTDAVNFAFIIKNYDITVNGNKYGGNLILRESNKSNQSCIELTLGLSDVTLKAGDKINIDMILLPWGETKSENDDNVKNVRKDTCIEPYKVDIKTGTLVPDTYIPTVKAENNTAEFTFSGGKNNGVVKVTGFSAYKLPAVSVKKNGTYQTLTLSGPNGHDGYQVNREDDGTYSFSFVLNTDNANIYELTIKQ